MMNRDEIWKKLHDIFRDILEDDSLVLSAKTTARDIEGWDSINHIQLLVAIEKEFGVKFNTGEVAHLANVGEIVNLIEQKV